MPDAPTVDTFAEYLTAAEALNLALSDGAAQLVTQLAAFTAYIAALEAARTTKGD